MSDHHPNGRDDPADAAERLSTAWDDLVLGRPVEADGDDALVGIARSLSATVTTVRGRPGFREDLRDTIMRSPASALSTPGAMPTPFHQRPAPRRLVMPTPASVGRLGVRWLGVAATVALLAATVGGGYLTGVGRPGGNAPATHLAAPFGASPEAGGTPVTAGCGPAGEVDLYTPCFERPNIVAASGIGGNFSANDLAVTNTQMQRWQLGGGESVTYTPLSDSVDGIGMDVVINGAYTARFSAPANVVDERSGIDNRYSTIPANTTVELVTGDVVTYELGTKLEVVNPFGSSMLWFKTILFYDGDPSPAGLNATGPVKMTIDGDGTLSMPLSEYGPSGVLIVLSYAQILPEYAFPPEWSKDKVILGPVDPVAGPVGTEGFILWAFQGQG